MILGLTSSTSRASRRSAKQSPVTLTEVLSAAKGDLDLLEHEAPVSASRRRGIANGMCTSATFSPYQPAHCSCSTAKYFLPGPVRQIFVDDSALDTDN